MTQADPLRSLLDELAALEAPEGPRAAAANDRAAGSSMLLEAPSLGGPRSRTPISDAAVDLIVTAEVSSRAVYERRLTRPVWPKGNSGLTIGIGYDVGTVTAATLEVDWSGVLDQAALDLLRPACLVRGAAAVPLVEQAQSVAVPWNDAMHVFREASLPEFVARTERALPNTAALWPDCLGALVSLTYNRGAAFNRPEPRFAEMRAIGELMAVRAFDRIPAELRAMKRLWEGDPDMRGVVLRREAEAVLFERGLAAMRAPRPEMPGAFRPEAVQPEGVLSWLGGWMRPVIEEPTRDFLMLQLDGQGSTERRFCRTSTTWPCACYRPAWLTPDAGLAAITPPCTRLATCSTRGPGLNGWSARRYWRRTASVIWTPPGRASCCR